MDKIAEVERALAKIAAMGQRAPSLEAYLESLKAKMSKAA